MKTIKCEFCGKEFITKKRNAKFCSSECSQQIREKKYEIRKCIVCSNDINKRYNQSTNDYAKAKYCSIECNYSKKVWNKGLTKEDPRVLSYSLKNKTQFTKGSTALEKNNNWKGEDASYTAKHIWINSNHGSANKCELCSTNVKRYHWSNLDNKYSRDIKDWIQLCPSCHKKFDLYKKYPEKYIKHIEVYNSIMSLKKDVV